MSDNNTIQLSVRIDKSTDDRISKVMKETGMNKSQVVKMLLNPQTTIYRSKTVIKLLKGFLISNYCSEIQKMKIFVLKCLRLASS